jgi:ATP-dependent RNA helicase RhlE
LNNLSKQSFRELGVSTRIVDQLVTRSILEPFDIQASVLPDALAGLDVLAKSPTGSGKTLAFAIPIVERTERGDGDGPRALVLVPTRELARQVSEELSAVGKPKGLAVAAIHGGVPLSAQAKRARRAHLLVATPGRLIDLLDRRLVELGAIRILVLDEADRMLDMGFKPQVDRIVRRLPRNRQTMFFSATLDGAVGELAREYTNSPSRFAADRGAVEDGEITHRFVAVAHDTKVESLVEHIRAAEGKTLVFVRTKRGADRLARKLGGYDVHAVAMHGDLSQGQRQRALARFERGDVSVLVATDVAARGLDIEHIAHVVNYDPPTEHKEYVHRTGRTGRAGREGTAVTFVLPDQQADTSRIANRLGHSRQFEDAGLRSSRSRIVYTSRRGRSSKW